MALTLVSYKDTIAEFVLIFAIARYMAYRLTHEQIIRMYDYVVIGALIALILL